MFDRLEELEKRMVELEQMLADPESSKNPQRYTALAKEHGALGKLVNAYRRYKKLKTEFEEARMLAGDETADEEFRDLAEQEAEEKERQLVELSRKLTDLLLSRDEGADRNAIVEIRAGTGGEEAALFAADVFRMYGHFAESRHWKMEILSSSPTELGGLREVVFSLSGPGAYGTMRYESGGHRVQRVPRTETQGRIHTSLVTVAVLPEAEEVDLDIPDDDLRIERITGGGPGGQSINKTASAVRVTHLPTGMIVHCQDERSQHRNLDKAMRILRSRLLEIEEERREKERGDLRRSMVRSGDRSEKVRTYNFPQNRVTDHRINKSIYDLDGILGGHLDDFVEALAQKDKEERLKNISFSKDKK
jgi:peptide chain release factor 1